MSSWRDKILEYFQGYIPQLMIVSDPDNLLLDGKILAILQEKNIDVLDYHDPVVFRYVYESKYRNQIENQSFHLLVRLQHKTVDELPFDILQIGQRINLRMSSLFPTLSTPIVKQLESQSLDALFAVYEQHQGSLTNAETCDYLLRKVFKVPYDMVETEPELLQLVFSKHYKEIQYPDVLDQFLIEFLKQKTKLNALPLELLIKSPRFFYDYLQKEWPLFLAKSIFQKKGIKESNTNWIYAQESHPFEELDFRPLLDTLFIEGKLAPVSGFSKDDLPKWTHIGLYMDDRVPDEKNRLLQLIEKINNQGIECLYYKDWIQLLKLFSEAKYLTLKLYEDLEESFKEKIDQIEKNIDYHFEQWVIKEYKGLPSLPHLPTPVMVHHVPHYLSAKRQTKLALVVMDGMSFVQWVQIRENLKMSFSFEEHGVFAWVPTITSVSRQSIFTGEIPLYFSQFIDTTRKEESAWRLFWENHSVSKLRISFEKGLGQETYESKNIFAVQKQTTVVAGIIIDTIDKLMHGAIQGLQGMVVELALWLQKGYLKYLLDDLIDQGFDVYITSDHGNKESIGIGRISEGVLAETRGERVRIYGDESLRNSTASRYSSIQWDNKSLPPDRFVLLAKQGEAFIKEKQRIVSHGGISIEEVIVPFVRVARKSNE